MAATVAMAVTAVTRSASAAATRCIRPTEAVRTIIATIIMRRIGGITMTPIGGIVMGALPIVTITAMTGIAETA